MSNINRMKWLFQQKSQWQQQKNKFTEKPFRLTNVWMMMMRKLDSKNESSCLLYDFCVRVWLYRSKFHNLGWKTKNKSGKRERKRNLYA